MTRRHDLTDEEWTLLALLAPLEQDRALWVIALTIPWLRDTQLRDTH